MTPRSGFRGRSVVVSAILAAILSAPSIGSAGDLVFGPVTCQRGTGAPTVFTYAFAVAEPSRGFILKVFNGGLDDTTYELVSSSVLRLNGVEILGPDKFNQNVTNLDVPVKLQAQNSLSVEVRGKPGGAMIIKIYPFVVLNAPAEDRIFSVNPITVSGRLFAAATEVSVNGLSAMVGTGTFSVTGVSLTEGSNTLTATATCENGYSGSDSVRVMLDSVPPTVAIVHPQEGLVTRLEVAPHYSVTDELDPNPQVTISPLPPYVAEGAYQMSVTATDWAGNQAQSTRSFTIDLTPPAIGALTPVPDAATAAAQGAISASFSDALSGIQAASIRLQIDGKDVPSGVAQVTANGIVYHPASRFSDGEHHAALTVADRAGNTATAAWRFVVDTTPPRITLLSHAEDASVAADTIDLYGSVDDPNATVLVNGTGVMLSGNNFRVAGVALAIGPNTLPIEARDVMGNNSAVAFHVTYVPVAPTASLTATPSQVQVGGSVVLTWTTENATSVSIAPAIGKVAAAGSLTVTPT